MKQFKLINIEWNNWNGFSLSFLRLEFNIKDISFDGEMFGIHASGSFFIVELFFIRFEIKSHFYNYFHH